MLDMYTTLVYNKRNSTECFCFRVSINPPLSIDPLHKFVLLHQSNPTTTTTTTPRYTQPTPHLHTNTCPVSYDGDNHVSGGCIVVPAAAFASFGGSGILSSNSTGPPTRERVKPKSPPVNEQGVRSESDQYEQTQLPLRTKQCRSIGVINLSRPNWEIEWFVDSSL